MSALLDLQFDIDGLVFGAQTDINMAKFTVGAADVVTNDAQRLRADGERFGRDYLTGRTLTFELNVIGDPAADPAAILNRLAVLASTWRNPSVRTVPGVLSTLRWNLHGRTRRVYGRGRAFLYDTAIDWVNVPVTCEFRSVSAEFYDDNPLAQTLSILPPSSGGFTFPVVYPLIAGGTGVHPGAITIGGDRPGWPVFTIYAVGGPLVNPAVSVVGGWAIGLNMTLQPGQSVTIDTRPWSRGVMTGAGANVAGYLTPTSPRLAVASLGPGSVEILLTGQDATNTAYLSTQIHQVFTSY